MFLWTEMLRDDDNQSQKTPANAAGTPGTPKGRRYLLGLGFRDLGFRVWGLGLGFRVVGFQSLGFRV